jgi:hypothetical protein
VTREEALAQADLPALLDRLGSQRGLSARGNRYPCPNPQHEQTGQSPPVYLQRGVYDLWCCPVCDAGGTAIDALVASGTPLAEALQELGVGEDRAEPRDDWTPEAEYVYQDAAGEPIFKVIRFPGKRFRQKRRVGAGWEWGMEGVTRQLFGLPEVLAAKAAGKLIFLTEGEKDAKAVQATGYCATTMPGGAGKWEPQYTETLAGCKVVILADDDEPGRRHAGTVWRELSMHAARVWLRLPAAGCKDVADHLAAGHSLKDGLRELKELIDLPANGNGNGRALLTTRAFAARSGSSESLEVLGPMFQRGMRTVIGAQTGEGKTSFALRAVHALVERAPFLEEPRWRSRGQGARALVVDLEQGEETLKTRIRETGLDSSERVDVLWEPSGIALDRREEDRAMVEDYLREGHYDLVLLDPLYQMHLGSGNDEEIAAATMRIVDGWARDFNCSIVIPMHARKPPHEKAGRSMTIHDIAGTTTWLRNAEFVLGLQLMFAGQSRLWFFKDRIGRGPEIRSHWWLDFNRESEFGYKRNHKEIKERVKRDMKALLKLDSGATRAELLEVEGANDLLVQDVLRRAHRRGEHYRSRKWPETAGADQERLIE